MHIKSRKSGSYDSGSLRRGREKLGMLSEIRCWRLIDSCVVMRFAISPERRREESDDDDDHDEDEEAEEMAGAPHDRSAALSGLLQIQLLLLRRKYLARELIVSHRRRREVKATDLQRGRGGS
jgi:hypothetical protein